MFSRGQAKDNLKPVKPGQVYQIIIIENAHEQLDQVRVCERKWKELDSPKSHLDYQICEPHLK
jgi:hypothetical protein